MKIILNKLHQLILKNFHNNIILESIIEFFRVNFSFSRIDKNQTYAKQNPKPLNRFTCIVTEILQENPYNSNRAIGDYNGRKIYISVTYYKKTYKMKIGDMIGVEMFFSNNWDDPIRTIYFNNVSETIRYFFDLY